MVKLRKLAFVLILIVLASCSSVPKGEYSRSQINRPYALPDEVASVQFGAAASKLEAENFSDSITEIKDDNYEAILPLLVFEQGISNSLSWVYPLGIKWNLLSYGSQTLGLSAYSLLLYNEYSIDYWYRLSKKLSIRPFYKNERLRTYFVDSNVDLFGTEVVFQATKDWALVFKYGIGKYKGRSPFFDDLLTSITGNEQDDSEIAGKISRYGLGSIYSFSERWDFRANLLFEKYKLDNFDVNTTRLDLTLVYFY